MVDNRDTTRGNIVVDASPLIYLAKLDALEVFEIGGYRPLVPGSVIDETTRPSLIYRHPDAALIETAVGRGVIRVVALVPGEEQFAMTLSSDVPGMHRGECEVLAVAHGRGIPAVLFERRGRAVARARRVRLLDLIEMLFDGTPEDELLERRVRRFAEQVDM